MLELFLDETTPYIAKGISLVIVYLLGWAATALRKYLDERGALVKLEKYRYLADIAVNSVEQAYKHEHGEEKLNKAKEVFVASLPKRAKVDSVQLDAFLEAAVKSMNEGWTTTVSTMSVGEEDIYNRFHERVGR